MILLLLEIICYNDKSGWAFHSSSFYGVCFSYPAVWLFSQKAIVLPYFYLKKKKIISVVALQKKGKKQMCDLPMKQSSCPTRAQPFSCASCEPVLMLGWRSSLLLRVTKKSGLGKGKRETKGPECSHQIGSWKVWHGGIYYSRSAATCFSWRNRRNKGGHSNGLEHCPVFASGYKGGHMG